MQIRLITPYPAGGATDVSSRLIAERLEIALKRPVIVENRAGATGNIGTAAVVNAPADGCTLLNNAAVIATFTSSFTKLPYDPIKDLTPIGGIGITPTLLVTASANPPNNLKELIEWSKSKPGGLNFSTAGYGLLQHLAVEEIGARSGGKFTHVAYRGGAQAVADLIPGRIDLGSFAAGSVLTLVKEGKLKALAVVAEKRSELVPDVPTTSEQGMSGLDAGVHFMLYAPSKTPKATVDRLSGELKKIVGDPALKQRFIKIGYDPTPTSSQDMIAVMHKTGEQWAPLIKRLNIKLD
ncbi:MAG: tripartite tricarboxylate transporter substrate binding protein [Rhizobiales bacterium]|jgi:tripartite-type tricarboxylate transporter receptor subunit TctC|nr:tripartite tricarboxylate transporter substrate binding protein [Hyphomicrobiales bacterium]